MSLAQKAARGALWTVISSVILTLRLLQGAAARVRGPLRSWLEELDEVKRLLFSYARAVRAPPARR